MLIFPGEYKHYIKSCEQDSKNVKLAGKIQKNNGKFYQLIWRCNYRFCRFEGKRDRRIFHSWHEATSHVLIHVAIPLPIKKCRMCETTLNTFHDGVTHFAKKHIYKVYKCKICRCFFSTLVRFELHLTNNRCML